MKRQLVFILLLLSMSINAMAQLKESIYGDDVKFDVKMDYVYSLEEAITKAQKLNKPIFFNCFADWAIPCHAMNKEVFSNQEFCDFMNKNYVNLIMDLSRKENAHIAKRYSVKSFAHFIVLDKNGELIHRITGGNKLPEFKDYVAQALNPKTSLKGLEERYKKGDRSKTLLGNYANALLSAGYREQFDIVKNEFANSVNKKEFIKKENFRILRNFANNVNSEWFKFLVDNVNELIKENGEDVIYTNIASLYVMYFYPYSVSSDGYKSEEILNKYEDMLKIQIPEKYTGQVNILYNIAKMKAEKRYDDLIKVINNGFGDIHEQIYIAIELSLATMPDMTPEQEQWVVNYLNKRAASLTGELKLNYENATKVVLKEGIKFETSSFKELLAKAKEQNKPVFVDCYTSWCGPCKTLSYFVFTMKEVGEFFNKEFISAKIDMEKGEGIELAKTYNIRSYPTLLILDNSGKEMYRIIGSVSPIKLLEEARIGLNICNNLVPVKAKYESGDRTIPLMAQYFEILGGTKEISDPKEKAAEYFLALPRKTQITPEAISIFKKFASSYNDKLFVFMMNNINDYSKIIDKEELNKIISKSYFYAIFRAIDQYGLSSAQVKSIISDIERYKMSDYFSMNLAAKLFRKFYSGDIAGLMEMYRKDVASMSYGPDMMNIDMLLLDFFKKATPSQKQDIKSYVESQKSKADSRSIDSYNKLMNNILKEE